MAIKVGFAMCLAVTVRACAWDAPDGVTVGQSRRQDFYVWDDANNNRRIDQNEPPVAFESIGIFRDDVPLGYTTGPLNSSWVAGAVSNSAGQAGNSSVPLGTTQRASKFTSMHGGSQINSIIRSRMDWLATRKQRDSWICVEYSNVSETRRKLGEFRDRTLDLNGLPWWQALVAYHGFVPAVEQRMVQAVDEKIVAQLGR